MPSPLSMSTTRPFTRGLSASSTTTSVVTPATRPISPLSPGLMPAPLACTTIVPAASCTSKRPSSSAGRRSILAWASMSASSATLASFGRGREIREGRLAHALALMVEHATAHGRRRRQGHAHLALAATLGLAQLVGTAQGINDDDDVGIGDVSERQHHHAAGVGHAEGLVAAAASTRGLAVDAHQRDACQRVPVFGSDDDDANAFARARQVL